LSFSFDSSSLFSALAIASSMVMLPVDRDGDGDLDLADVAAALSDLRDWLQAGDAALAAVAAVAACVRGAWLVVRPALRLALPVLASCALVTWALLDRLLARAITHVLNTRFGFGLKGAVSIHWLRLSMPGFPEACCRGHLNQARRNVGARRRPF
jgi:hypothetical protein